MRAPAGRERIIPPAMNEIRYCVRCGKGLVVASIDGRPRAQCRDCGWISWDHAKPVVLVLAVSPTGRIVLTRDSRFPPDRWGLVAGYIERGETAEEAALRELAEEAGLEGREPRVVGTDVSGESVIVCVLCRIVDGDIATTGHSETERSMGTEVQLAAPDLARIMPDSAASRIVQRLISGELWRPLQGSSGGQVGRVILLNGAPSSGKTTIARALWEVLEPPHWYRSLDDFRKGYTDRHWDAARGPWSGPADRPLFRILVEGYLGALRAMALARHHVISESVILPSNLAAYLEAFGGLSVFLVGLRCPLDVAEQRERSRAPAERHQGEPIDLRVPEFDLVHSHGAYDLELDTSVTAVADAVQLIRSRLDSPPVAFEALRARHR